jgi:hypothetical protein
VRVGDRVGDTIRSGKGGTGGVGIVSRLGKSVLIVRERKLEGLRTLKWKIGVRKV